LIGESPSRLHTIPPLAYALGFANEFTWRPAFTADFVKRLQYDVLETKDNPDILKFKDVGIIPQNIETAAHEFLARWKRNPDYFLVSAI
jgi:hypothetical protein